MDLDTPISIRNHVINNYLTMLPVEFYFLNATTTLLWLCQTVPHEVLLFLLVLGALCVLVSICIVVFRIVC